MAYVEVGKGDPIVFIHGNPASSYLWRNVMPPLVTSGRLIAVDLLGMGDSDKLPPGNPKRYTLEKHMNFLTALLKELGVEERVTLVTHNWGSFFGVQWAYMNRQNKNAVKGIVLMEPLLWGFKSPSPLGASLTSLYRSPIGQKKLMNDNDFIEIYLRYWIIRKLSRKEMDEWRRPFQKPGESRRAMAQFILDLPLDGKPFKVSKTMAKLRAWLAKTKVKKLFFDANPGLTTPLVVKQVKKWPVVKTVKCKGIHYVQEDDPHLIGKEIAKWLKSM